MDGTSSIRGAAEASDEKPSDRGACYATVSFSEIARMDVEGGTADGRLTPNPSTLQRRYGREGHQRPSVRSITAENAGVPTGQHGDHPS